MFLALVVWLVMTVFPAMKVIAIILTVTLAIATFVCSMCAGIDDNHAPLTYLRSKLKYILPAILIGFMAPTERTSWYMVGAYATQTVVQSETAKQFAGDGVDVLHSLMKKAKEKIDNYDAEDAPKEAKAK